MDDDSHIGELLVEVLRQEGYRVAWVRNAHQALEQMSARRAGLVLCDVMLPGMSGIDLVARLGRLRPPPSLALMSAAPRPAHLPNGVPFLRKPFELETLLDLIGAEAGNPPGSRSRRRARQTV